MSEEIDLSLVTTDALIAEIKRRYDVTLICLERAGDKTSTSTVLDYGGGINACIGIAAVAQARLTQQAMDDLSDEDGDTEDVM